MASLCLLRELPCEHTLIYLPEQIQNAEHPYECTDADIDERDTINVIASAEESVAELGHFAYVVGDEGDNFDMVKDEIETFYIECAPSGNQVKWFPVGEPYFNPQTRNWEVKVLKDPDKRRYGERKAAREAKEDFGPTLKEVLAEIERKGLAEDYGERKGTEA